MAKVLVTGFDRFASYSHNTSQEIVEALVRQADADLCCEVLPTCFRVVAERLEHSLTALAPDAVLLLGQTPRSRALVLERRAHNWDAAESRDNEGEQRVGQAIVPGAPEFYESTLPLERFAERVRALGAPVEYSDHAGGFLCNHAFYRARHVLERAGARIPCGFLHVPWEASGQFALWLGAVQACLRILQSPLS